MLLARRKTSTFVNFFQVSNADKAEQDSAINESDQLKEKLQQLKETTDSHNGPNETSQKEKKNKNVEQTKEKSCSEKKTPSGKSSKPTTKDTLETASPPVKYIEPKPEGGFWQSLRGRLETLLQRLGLSRRAKDSSADGSSSQDSRGRSISFDNPIRRLLGFFM